MTTPLTWRKSSRSETDQCVEVRSDLGAIRDSKNPEGPALVFAPSALAEFVQRVKRDAH